MITIVYFVPYKELLNVPWNTYEKHPLKMQVELIVLLSDVNVKLEEVAPKCDVIVARGLDADRFTERFNHIPVVKIQINAYDILDALQNCKAEHNPKQVGMIGNLQMCEGAEHFSELLGIRIKKYVLSQADSINDAVERAASEGCDAIVGGTSICRTAEAHGMLSSRMKTGVKAIEAGLEEAIRLTLLIRQEHQRSESFRQILEGSKEGILMMNADREFSTMNGVAQKLAEAAIVRGVSGSLQEVFSFMIPHADEVFKSGREKINVLHEMANLTISTSYIPVLVKGSVANIIITLVDILKLQQTEAQIRNKLHAKGLQATHHFQNFIHVSDTIGRLLEKAKKMALVDSTILISGESGTGKELLAQSIHNYSPRRYEPFVAVNCAALPENLLESELFGYSPGAFTGASKEGRIGLFELAHKGTLFLDEISEMPLNFQCKLLRAIQESQISRVGSNAVTTVNVRLIAASNQNLLSLVEKGRFRLDLLFRLNVLQLSIPPLRRRTEDIIPLFHHHLRLFNEKFEKNITSITPQAQQILAEHQWPGNVRELRNIAEQLCVLSTSYTINEQDVSNALYPALEEAPTLAASCEPVAFAPVMPERDSIVAALKENGFSKNITAQVLGISRSALWRKMKKYNIQV